MNMKREPKTKEVKVRLTTKQEWAFRHACETTLHRAPAVVGAELCAALVAAVERAKEKGKGWEVADPLRLAVDFVRRTVEQ